MPAFLVSRAVVQRLFLPFVLLGLSACASVSPPPTPGSCDARYVALEELAAQRGIALSDPRRVPGFPSLGTNRSLASFDPGRLSLQQRADWLARLQAAGLARRQLLQRMLLDSSAFAPLPDHWDAGLQSCDVAHSLAAHDPALDWQALRSAVKVDDDYLLSRRILGLYPLSSIFAGLGVQSLQNSIYDSYAQPLSEIPQSGRLVRYALPEPTQPGKSTQAETTPLIEIARDSLGLRLDQRSATALKDLFVQHAPGLEIDESGVYDIPGEPYFDQSGYPGVATESSYAYYYASLMPFAGELRLQLNYVFWFAERPPEHAMDSLSGVLDGLVWRVTLDSAGEVLLYDSIHPCGCYQQFFLSDRVEARPENARLREPPLLPQKAPPASAPVLRLSSGAHYLQRVYTRPAKVARDVTERSYTLADYSELYSRQSAQGFRSLFDPDGFVPRTERGERFYLWPMGIRSPGAMRERGRQPTAFVGRRHFDDANLLDTLFQLRQP
ncbi:hypothetical protein NOR53_2976 [gamma proteobacterium NOR5-3]|nr:hypothetical protein NOR53_2976 [gamma proteobacterium NOR5-3]